MEEKEIRSLASVSYRSHSYALRRGNGSLAAAGEPNGPPRCGRASLMLHYLSAGTDVRIKEMDNKGPQVPSHVAWFPFSSYFTTFREDLALFCGTDRFLSDKDNC